MLINVESVEDLEEYIASKWRSALAPLRKSGSSFANNAKFHGQPTANKQRQTVLLRYHEEQELFKVLKGKKINFCTLCSRKSIKI